MSIITKPENRLAGSNDAGEPVKIRDGNGNDFPEIFRLINEFAGFQKTPDRVLVTLDQMNSQKELFRCFVAEDDEGRILAFATFFLCYYSWSGKALYLDDLYVTEAHRGQGIGKRLLEAVLEFARQRHCIKVKWQVSKWNYGAIEFYKRMGASIDEVEINCEVVLK
jgi:diamine N-acetyltransferase